MMVVDGGFQLIDANENKDLPVGRELRKTFLVVS
jgi:hypothetical protein